MSDFRPSRYLSHLAGRVNHFQSNILKFVVFLGLLVFYVFVSVTVFAQDNPVTISGDLWRWYPDDRITGTGNIRAVYLDYTVTADSVEADLKTNEAIFSGHVKLSTKNNLVEGSRLTINLKTREWLIEEASSSIQVGAGEPPGIVFAHTTSTAGSEKEVHLHLGTLTTCDLEHPHYFLSAKEIEIYPDSKLIARKVSLVGLGRRIFTFPSLVIPIRGFRYGLLPQVGSSAEEGMFLKTSYAYTATENALGYLKLDFMQKRGIGTGLEHTYKFTAGSGQASLYYLADREIGGANVTGRLQHDQKFGSLSIKLTGDYRTNNYLYYPSSTYQSWQASLSRITTGASTALTLRSGSTRGFGTTRNSNASLRHTQQLGRNTLTTLSMDMRDYGSVGMPTADRELESVLQLRRRDDNYDISLSASLRTDLDADRYTGDNFYSSLDRLPELVFETDSYRSGAKLLGLPSRLAITAGRYREMPDTVTSNRFLLEWDMLGQTFDLGARNELNLTAGFRQAYYASDAMQYVTKANSTLTTRFSDCLRSRVNYYYQEVEGYSPFRFDYTGQYNYIRGVLEYQDSQKLRWSLSGGYDFKRDENNWQDLSFRLTAKPNSKLTLATSTGYDLNRSKWRALITQMHLADRERLMLDIGTRYDIQTGKLGLARGKLDWRIGDKWRLQGITSWNGLTKKYDYKAFRLTRDLHCWEVSLSYTDETGFRRDKGFSLDFRIKVFPTVDRFGIGQYGQMVDTTMGEYYY